MNQHKPETAGEDPQVLSPCHSKKIPRRYIGLPPAIVAVAALTGFRETPPDNPPSHPNILLIMVDQMQTPPEGYGPYEGAVQDMKELLGFRPVSPGNTYSKYFEGFRRLQQNGVVMKKHYTASAASVPSRCCIMTGQYPTVTGVTQTDGLFKSDQDVPWLDPNGTPTIGDWFSLVGYSTHYFGKWHVSDATPPGYLLPYGFADWLVSYPEPHGGSADNLGVYRDVIFADHVVDFLDRQGKSPSEGPWFTVASLVNPHDVSSMPVNWQVPDTNGVVPWKNYPPTLTIPALGDTSLWGTVRTVTPRDTLYKTFRVPLNPDGFPQENSFSAPTFGETLEHKPLCQYDFSYKMGLAFGANTDNNFRKAGDTVHASPHPFQLQGNEYENWCLSYTRFYFYCQYLADLQIRRILKSLDDNGLIGNTIVVFLSDHGDLTAAHGGMIQKWHNAYEEAVRVPLVVSSPLVNSSKDTLREIIHPTSSIDLVPTLLGLAGFNADSLVTLAGGVSGHTSAVFPGVNLAPYIKGINTGPITGSDGKPRTGVLFMSNDMVTEIGDESYRDPYNLFLHRIDSTINLGYHLAQNPVRQPNNVRAFCTGDWKIVQYVDPDGTEAPQWELYCLTYDSVELINLDDYATGQVREDVSVPGMTRQELILKNEALKKQLAALTGVTEAGPGQNHGILYQNSPNPFTDRTTVSFYIPEAGAVHLAVTDLTGREVELLVDRALQPGYHHQVVDASRFAQGVYLIRLTAGRQQLARKMVVVK